MPHRLLPLIEGPLGNLLAYLGGGLAALAGGIRMLIAQADPAGDGMAAMPGYLSALGIFGGLVVAVTPLVLRVVDLARLRKALRDARHYLRNVEQQRELTASENRRLRDEFVRASRKYDFDLPAWFYSDPPAMPGTGDFPLLTDAPDPDADSRQ